VRRSCRLERPSRRHAARGSSGRGGAWELQVACAAFRSCGFFLSWFSCFFKQAKGWRRLSRWNPCFCAPLFLSQRKFGREPQTGGSEWSIVRPSARFVSRGSGLRQGERRTDRQENIHLWPRTCFEPMSGRAPALRPAASANAVCFEPYPFEFPLRARRPFVGAHGAPRFELGHSVHEIRTVKSRAVFD
jgi:hypothetical protein